MADHVLSLGRLFLSSVRFPLVKEKFLPYESTQQGSLENQSGNGENVRLLSMFEELNASLEEELRRLVSLHSLEKKIIYREIKAAKILLDNQYGDGNEISMLQKYGTKKDAENQLWDDKMISQLQDKSSGCDLISKREEFFKNSMQRASFFSIREPMSIDGFGGKHTKYEHSDEARSKQMHCIGKNMTKKILFDADDLSHEFGFVYFQKGEVHDANDDWDGKISSQLQDKSTGCNLNKYEEPFSQDKGKETMQRVISCLIATIVFLWIIFHTCTHSSTIQVQPLHKQHGPVFIWSSLLEPFCFMVLVWAIATTIVAGAPFSRMHSAMLMFWAILMLVKSAKSITEVYVPILGILFTGYYVLLEKQPLLN